MSGQLTFQTMDTCGIVDLQPLRALRLWHWRQVLLASKARDHVEYILRECNDRETRAGFEERLKVRKAEHAMHMGAVQTLNSFFAIGDTAERDDI